jgi:hypothetical protein
MRARSGRSWLARVGARQEGSERGVQARSHPRTAMEFTSIPAAVYGLAEAI